MRIVVNDIAASSGGAKTVLNDFYQYLVDSNDQNEWIFLLGEYDLKETEHIRVIKMPEIKRNKFKKLWFDFVKGKKIIETLKPDVVFSLQNIITFGLKCPQVVYVHQPLPFQKVKKYSFGKVEERPLAIYQHLIGRIIKKSIKKANLTIVQTNWMRRNVIEQCRVENSKVKQIKPNINYTLFENIKVKEEFVNTEFFYPTSNVIYKNNDLILESAKMLDEKKLNYHYTLTLDNERASKYKITYVGHLSYEEVIRKYYTACLVFPSYIETFGYPLIEARAAGTIILASDCEFSRELLDDYENAYFFNPFNVEELVSLMEKVITGKIVKKQIIENRETKENSWKSVVDELVRLKFEI